MCDTSDDLMFVLIDPNVWPGKVVVTRNVCSV